MAALVAGEDRALRRGGPRFVGGTAPAMLPSAVDSATDRFQDQDAKAAIAAVSKIAAVPTMLRVITEITGLRLALVARVTETRWTCCAVNDQMEFGLEPGGELDVSTTLCTEVRQARAAIIISHASTDPCYAQHATPKLYGFESYIAVPIFLPGGDYFGNVCALDSRPVDLSHPRTLALFQLFAELVGLQLAAEAEQAATSRALLDARETSELREQFIAVLGHDLRSPLQAIAMGTHVLAATSLPEPASTITRRMARSVDRMTHLIDDVVDFARGRLGGGIPLEPSAIADIAALLRDVVDELRAIHPDRNVTLETDANGPMTGDPVRLAQLLQNLLANALTHSPPGTSVAVQIHLTATHLRLQVTNGGPAIPETIRARMFEPYRRGTEASPAGLGLGLYIAAQIVRSHAGTIEATSIDGQTTMTCTIPRSPT